MKQMISRLDDELHARLKKRAAAQGRSLNDLVVTTLASVVNQPLTRETVRERARTMGMLVVPTAPERLPTPAEVAAATRGSGQAVSDALEADRGQW